MNRAQDGRVARSQYQLLAAHVLRLILFFATTSVFGQALAPGDFGFFVLVSALFVVANEALDLGTSSVSVREIAQRPADERRLLTAVLSWRRILALVLAVACAAVALIAFEGWHRVVLLAAAVGIAMLRLSAYHLVFQVRHRWGAALAAALALQAAFLLAGLGVIAAGLAGAVVALFVVVREAGLVTASRVLAVPMLGEALHPSWRDPEVRTLLKTAWVFGLAALCYKLSANAGNFLLWALGTPETVGTYGAAHRLVMPSFDLAAMFVVPLGVVLSRAAGSDETRFREELAAHLECLAGAGAVVAVCAVATAPLLLDLLYGGRYTHGATSAFRALAIGMGFAIATPILAAALLAKRSERVVLAAGAAGLVLNAVAAFAAIPRYGAVGAAVTTAAAQAAVFAALLGYALAVGAVRPRLAWLSAMAPAALLAALLEALARWPLAQLAAAIVLGAVALVALWSMPPVRACRSRRVRESVGAGLAETAQRGVA